MFNGLGCNLTNLSRMSNAKTRSISPESFTGEEGKAGMYTEGAAKSCARELGVGWKVSPYVRIAPGEVFTLADIHDQGAIQHMWMTISDTAQRRYLILRIYWDDSDVPSVECPFGDFFASAYNLKEFNPLVSAAVCVNPNRGFNSYWEMPFRKGARITLENLNAAPCDLFYSINYAVTEVPEDCGYFHAQFRRVNPLPYKDVYTIVDGISGKGQYVGTYMAWGSNNNGWWGEGEIKFYMDGDTDYPTICGTGTEDYFCGAYCFRDGDHYVPFCSPYSGFFPTPQDGLYQSNQRFSLYRWHICDPIRFESDLRVTIQALGWRSEERYLPLQDDMASVAFWYQDKPAAAFPALPDRDGLEII